MDPTFGLKIGPMVEVQFLNLGVILSCIKTNKIGQEIDVTPTPLSFFNFEFGPSCKVLRGLENCFRPVTDSIVSLVVDVD